MKVGERVSVYISKPVPCAKPKLVMTNTTSNPTCANIDIPFFYKADEPNWFCCCYFLKVVPADSHSASLPHGHSEIKSNVRF